MKSPETEHAWPLPLDTANPGLDVPVYRRLADAIALDIRRGRLAPGDRLPSSRALAAQAGVHRNTALAAYDELIAQGWIVTAEKRGTFVADDLPAALPAVPAPGKRPAAPAFSLGPPPVLSRRDPPAGALHLGGGLPDARLLATAELSRAVRRVLKARGPALLSYGEARGEPRLRAALCRLLARTRAVVAADDELLITRGSQMGLYLIGRALLRPGDRVAVERLGYSPAWDALRQTGAELLPVAIDAAGLDVDALIALHQKRPVRAVYVTPHHQFPTTCVMSQGRRLQLLDWAAQQGVAIIEDDYDHEFHYEGRPVLPLASEDARGQVVYVGTLSKVFAPGVRIGYVVAPRAVVDRLVAHRTLVDRQGDQVMEAAVAELIEEGELMRHVGRARRAYRARRDHLVHRLSTILPDEVGFTAPHGGMALWLTVHGLDADRWQAAILARGVWLTAGRRYAFDGRAQPHLRMGFAAGTEAELDQAVAAMANSRRAAG